MSYKEKVEELIQSTGFEPGLHTVRIEHDSWCAIYSGVGLCNCDAKVSLESSSPDPNEHSRIFADGLQAMRQGHERYKKIGRNEPCPCGSLLKFKKCHGSVTAEA
jgi:SEC-C motif